MSTESLEVNNSVCKLLIIGLMFILCSIRRIRKDQQYALLCTISVFYILVPTCFGSSLSSSGCFLDTPELLEIQMEWVVYHIVCGYVRSQNHTLYDIPPIRFVYQVTQEDLRSCLMMAGYC
jgi:hypothetical protein